MTRPRLLPLAALACAFCVFALWGVASADPSVLTDSNDAMGLDVSRVTLAADVPPPVWTIRTFRPWTIPKLWDRGYFMVEIDTMGGAPPEYRAVARSNGKQLVGALYHVRDDGKSVQIAKLRTHKVDARTVSIRVPLSKLAFGPDRTSYNWDVLTSYTSAKCAHGVCFDRAPDSGSVEQPLPA
ncbi:MAG: hypothetical protein ACJ758_04045 [Actinomycetota bacterium]